jgi:hypothetical protein
MTCASRLAFILAICLVSIARPRAEEPEKRLPGVPSVAEIVKKLASRSDDDRLIKGFFRLLPKEDTPALEAAWSQRRDQLNIEMVRRGYAPAVNYTVQYVLNPQNDYSAYYHRLLAELNADELKPLAKAVLETIRGKKQFNYGHHYCPVELF